MDELTNPFRPGAGTPPPALVGRDDLLNKFGLTIRRTLAGLSGKSVMPIGLRGVGKTVLLNRFTEIAKNEGFQTVFIEATELGELRAVVARKLRQILLKIERGKPSQRLLRALRVLKSFSATMPDGVSFSVNVDPLLGVADSGDLADDLTDLLVAVGEAMAERKTGLLLAVDEVQYLSREELGALITAIHRVSQLGLPVVVVGAGLPQLPALAGEAKSYSERLFDFPLIDRLSASDAAIALTAPALNQGVEFDKAALNEIYRITDGYPYFLQEWGYHVWNAASGSPITVDIVNSTEPDVKRQLDENFFRVRFERLTPKEREYLWAMADIGPGPYRSGDIASKLKVKVESVAPRRSALISKGMIYSPSHGDTAFTVPLFDQLLRRQQR